MTESSMELSVVDAKIAVELLNDTNYEGWAKDIMILIVMESTIVATIHCPDVGYCLFRNLLVTHISYHVPSLLL